MDSLKERPPSAIKHCIIFAAIKSAGVQDYRKLLILSKKDQDTLAYTLTSVMVSNVCPHIRSLCCPFPLPISRFSFHHKTTSVNYAAA